MAPIELGRYAKAVEGLDEAAALDPRHPFAEAGRQVAAEFAGSNVGTYCGCRRLVQGIPAAIVAHRPPGKDRGINDRA